jgi:hypothetical protein
MYAKNKILPIKNDRTNRSNYQNKKDYIECLRLLIHFKKIVVIGWHLKNI